MIHLVTILAKRHRLCLAIAILMLSLLSSPASLSQAADNEFGGRYRAGETPAGLTAAEWVQVRAHIEHRHDTAQAGTDLLEDLPVQQAYVKASNTGAQDWFGYAVALSGDTLVVGAPFESSAAVGIDPPDGQSDNSASQAGAVYVFTRSGGVWNQQAYLKASNTGGGDLFGSAIALSEDTLAVGASGEASNAGGVNGNQADNSARNAGAVYVFTRSAGVWSQQAYVKASNTEAGDLFGSAVALSGDTLAVGSDGEDSSAVGVNNGNQADNSAPDAGAVYVFSRSNGVWSQQAYLKASNSGAGDNFGSAVTLSGDTLAVGSWGEASNAQGVNSNQADNSAPHAGAVYVFTRGGGAWSQQAYLKASNTEAGDRFGRALALSGDILAVGAPLESSSAVGVDPPGGQTDNSASAAGAVYVFARSGGGWIQQAYLKASNTGLGDLFGWAVALGGDVLAAGSRDEASNAGGVNPPGGQLDNSAPGAGAVYVFTWSGSTWDQQAYVKASNTEMYDRFGGAVALNGDSLAVGAFGESSSAVGVNNGNQADNSSPEAGATYVLTGFGRPGSALYLPLVVR